MNDVTLRYHNQRYEQSQSIFNQFPTTKRIVGEVFSSVNLDIDKKEDRRKAMLIGGTALIAGGGALFFSKGFVKFAKKGLDSLKEFLEGKLEASSVDNSKKKLYDNLYESIFAFAVHVKWDRLMHDYGR